MHGCAMMPAWIGSPWLRYGTVALLAAGAAWTAQGWRYGERIALIERDQAQVLENMATASSVAMESTLEEERRRYAALEIARDNAEKMAATAAADATARAASERRLRNRVDALAADARARYPAAAQGGPATGSSIDLLAYMLGRISEAAGELAEHGDAARNAGLTCEAVYDGVRGGQRQNQQQNIHKNIPGVMTSTTPLRNPLRNDGKTGVIAGQ